MNEYIQGHMGDEFTPKDVRTCGGTLIAAILFAERDLPDSEEAAERIVAE